MQPSAQVLHTLIPASYFQLVEKLRVRFAESDWFDKLDDKELEDDDDDQATISAVLGTGKKKGGADDDDEEVYGDFEDLESGEQFVSGKKIGGSSSRSRGDEDEEDEEDGEDDEDGEEYDEEDEEDEEEEDDDDEHDDDGDGVIDDEDDMMEGDVDEQSREITRLQKKLELKQQFNSEYDDDDDESKANFFEATKARLARQAQIDASEFANEDPELQIMYRGYTSGTYVRLEIANVPCEFVEHFDPHFPIVVGGLAPQEENMGFLQVRIKRHRWHRKVLKNKDPLIFSLGWRRFQSIPIYSLADDSMKHRMIKYTPEHMHCYATFYGPITPPNTGFVCVQSLQSGVSSFRICATGVVLELNQWYGGYTYAAPGTHETSPLTSSVQLPDSEEAEAHRNAVQDL